MFARPLLGQVQAFLRAICGRQVAAILVLQWAALFAASANAASGPLQVSRTPSGSTLALTGGESFYATPESIWNARLVSDSDELIALWDEGLPGGTLASQYAIRTNGAWHTRTTEYLVRLQYEEFDPLLRVPEVDARLAAPPDSEIYLVQFFVPPLDSFRHKIAAVGGTTLRFLPDHVYVIRMSRAAREQVAALDYVRWVGPYHPAYRIEKSIIPTLFNAAPEAVASRYSIEVFERGPGQQQAVANRITGLGGIVEFTVPEGFRLETSLTPAQLLEIARMEEINFIDRWGGPPEADMDIARQIGGANEVEGTCGFSGQGVRGEVMDTGLRVTHQAFQNPAPLIHGVNTGNTQHGTSTFGIVFGNGAANMAGRGMLPGREQGIFAAYSVLVGMGGTVTRYAHTAQLVDPAGPYRAVLQSNSWGSTSQTSVYTTISAEMDDITFLTDIVIAQSQGNNNSTISRPQAWAKNVVSAGGVNHHNTLTKTDDNWAGASIGPATDTRVKPNFTHFYDLVLCPTNTSDTAYTPSFSGTSSATPIIAGHFGVMFQMWHEGVFPGFGGGPSVFDDRPRLSTARALMVNSGSQYPFTTPTANLARNKQGWGLPDLSNLYKSRDRAFIVNESDLLAPLQVRTYTLEVAPDEPALMVTMVYTDPQGNPSSTQARINDLTLKVSAPTGTIYWGNNGLTAGNWSTSDGTPNTKDTIENVFIQHPDPGMWTIEVSGDEIVQDSHTATPEMDAAFGLVVSGVVLPATSVEIAAADPPLTSPYTDPGAPAQPFRDVLQTGTGPDVTQGIGAAGTPDEAAVIYATIDVTFSAAPIPAPQATNVTISCTGGACPTVTSVSGCGHGPYHVALSSAIPPGECTTLTFAGTTAGQKLQYQSLPGDVNLDGTSNTQDLLLLAQWLVDGTANQPSNYARCNVDRSVQITKPVNTQDLLRLIQLLNGVNTTQEFQGAIVTPCP